MKELILSKGQKALVDDDDFYWLSQWNWSAVIIKGKIYAKRVLKKTKLRNCSKYETYIHRVIMRLTDSTLMIDHIDGNTLNNQKDNLRIVTHTQNNWHRSANKIALSKYVGVFYKKDRNRWSAVIKRGDFKFSLGSYNSEKDAAIAYDLAIDKYSKGFGKKNFPNISHDFSLEEHIKKNKIVRKLTKEHIRKMQDGKLKAPDSTKKKKVVDTKTGVIYKSIKDVSKDLHISYSHLTKMLKGTRLNTTSLKLY